MTEDIKPKKQKQAVSYEELKERFNSQHLVGDLTRKDIRLMGTTMSDTEARLLVDFYYIAQENRKRFDNQLMSMEKEPNMILGYMGNQSTYMEDMLQKALNDYTIAHPIGEWLRDIHGIGPVIAAGLLAHIDITKAPTVGHIWNYAGLNPDVKWEKGQVRPFNMALKVLCYKAGLSFVKSSGSEKSFYGPWYKKRKEREVAMNEAGEYKHRAKEELESKNYSKGTPTYECLIAGKLCPAHLDARARRWTVKLFLSHLHGEWYRSHYGEEPPKPYPIGILQHAHMIEPQRQIKMRA